MHVSPIRHTVAAALALIVAATLPASAQQKPTRPAPAAESHASAAKPASNAPKQIGKFDDWIAATHDESGQTVCYAFTRASSSQPAMPGRGDVVLTVTERTTPRDAVAISAGFAYPANASVNVASGATTFEFYTAQRSAFARDGRATIGAFQKGDRVVAKSPTPKGTTVTDTFSLRGFTAAYREIIKACPAK